MGVRSAIVVLLSAALASLACSSWPKVREEVVEPIHHLLHHDLPAALEAGDRAKLAGFFSASATASD